MSTLDVRRKAIKTQIGNNPFTLTLKRPTSSATPGSGSPRYAAPFSNIVGGTARVAFRTKAIPGLSQGTPQESDRAWFLLTDHEHAPQAPDEFDDGEGRAWVVTNIEPLSKFGGVIGYESDIRRRDGGAGT